MGPESKAVEMIILERGSGRKHSAKINVLSTLTSLQKNPSQPLHKTLIHVVKIRRLFDYRPSLVYSKLLADNVEQC